MESLYQRFYLISKQILEAYGKNNFDKLEHLINCEKELYQNLDIITLRKFDNYINSLSNDLNIDMYEDYEIVLYNKDNELIIRRIINKLSQIYNIKQNYNNEYNYEKDVMRLNSNITLIIPNSDIFLSELYYQLVVNIDIKYLYFIIDDDELTTEKKQSIFTNSLFINSYLEDKLLNPKINLEEFIKTEDTLYNNLWEYIKEIYQEYLEDYCKNNILLNMSMMISAIDINNQSNTIARSIYLRTLFNYLDEEILEEINYDYNEQEREIYNILGDKYIRKSFRTIEQDKVQIEKIKTR